MAEQHTTSETTWTIRLDRALDQILFLEDKIKRATTMLEDLIVLGSMDTIPTVSAADLTDVMLALVETRTDSDLRRYPVVEEQEPVLASTSTNTKEDQQ